MPNSDLPFNLEEAIEHIKAGKLLNGKDGLLTPLIKNSLPKATLRAEQEAHIAADPVSNQKTATTARR